MKGFMKARKPWNPPIQKYSECCSCKQWSFKWGCMKPKRLGAGATITFPCDETNKEEVK